MAALDTNIILDVLITGEPFGESSKELLDRHLSKGKLILCEVVVAELSAMFTDKEELATFLTDTRINLVYSNKKSLYMAGSTWAEYARKSAKNRLTCGKCGHEFPATCTRCRAILTKRRHVLADFLIDAHALVLRKQNLIFSSNSLTFTTAAPVTSPGSISSRQGGI